MTTDAPAAPGSGPLVKDPGNLGGSDARLRPGGRLTRLSADGRSGEAQPRFFSVALTHRQSAPRCEKDQSREGADMRRPPEVKVCARCRLTLPAARFRRNLRMKTMLHSWCKRCCVERNRLWRAANPDYVAIVNDARREGPFSTACEACGVVFEAVRRDSVRCPPCQAARRRARDRLRKQRSRGGVLSSGEEPRPGS